MKLENAKWERFCLEYAKKANATDSYKNAGYKETMCLVNGSWNAMELV